MKLKTTRTGPENHRRFPRKAIKPGYAGLTLICGGETHEGHIYDISMGGIRFEIDRPIEAGQTVDLQLDLPGIAPHRRAICAKGVVVRHHDPDELGPVRMGLSFTGMATAGDRKRLAGFLNRPEAGAAVA